MPNSYALKADEDVSTDETPGPGRISVAGGQSADGKRGSRDCDGQNTAPTSGSFSPREKRGVEEILREAVTLANDKGGMHCLEWDVIKTASWAIAGSSGAVTKTHHDAGGFLTYVEPEVGAKIWVFLVPKEPPRTLYQAMTDFHYVVVHSTDSAALAKRMKPVYVYVAPGTLL